jgi:hypothetical protein
MSAVSKSPFERVLNVNKLHSLQISAPKYKLSLEAELSAMKAAGI